MPGGESNQSSDETVSNKWQILRPVRSHAGRLPHTGINVTLVNICLEVVVPAGGIITFACNVFPDHEVTPGAIKHYVHSTLQCLNSLMIILYPTIALLSCIVSKC